MRVRLVFESAHGLDRRPPQIAGPVAWNHDRRVNCGDHIHAGVAALDLEHNITSDLLRSDKLHLIDRSHRLELATGKEAVLAGVDSYHLELAQLSEFLIGHSKF